MNTNNKEEGGGGNGERGERRVCKGGAKKENKGLGNCRFNARMQVAVVNN